MELFAHRLLTELIAGNGTRLVTHYDKDPAVLPEARYPTIFSEANTRVHFEDEEIDIDRPLLKDIFLVGSVAYDEHPASYSIPIERTYVLDGEAKTISTRDSAVQIISELRITMITDNEVNKQARGKLHLMKLFAIQAFTNPPTQDWWRWAAHITGFTSTMNVPMANVLDRNEEHIIGRSFGVKFDEFLIRSEHLTLEKL